MALDAVRNDLAELDENLVRRQLTALQEADALARRKELYEALHPQTRHSVAGAAVTNEKRWGEDVAVPNSATATSVPSFADSTAEVMGVSRRTVNASVQIANNLSEEAQAVVKGTSVEDSKVKLLQVVQFPRDRQGSTMTLYSSGSPRDKRAAEPLRARYFG